ncbi:MAG: hypothetical protein ACRDKT_14460 [Actinomycetota bacterium]
MLQLLIVLLIIGLLEGLAYRYGRDSSDGDNWSRHCDAECIAR